MPSHHTGHRDELLLSVRNFSALNVSQKWYSLACAHTNNALPERGRRKKSAIFKIYITPLFAEQIVIMAASFVLHAVNNSAARFMAEKTAATLFSPGCQILPRIIFLCTQRATAGAIQLVGKKINNFWRFFEQPWSKIVLPKLRDLLRTSCLIHIQLAERAYKCIQESFCVISPLQFENVISTLTRSSACTGHLKE